MIAALELAIATDEAGVADAHAAFYAMVQVLVLVQVLVQVQVLVLVLVLVRTE